MSLRHKLVLGELGVNCYILENERKECLIIDPADEAEAISEFIEEKKLKPKLILATHGHFDHLMAAVDLKLMYQIRFYCSALDEFLVKNINQSASYWLKRRIKTPKLVIDDDLDVLDKIRFDEINIEIIKTPGHSPGGVCFYLPKEKILFSGDTLFKDTVGRTDFSYGGKNELATSLKKLFKLPGETVVLPGHGEETTIGGENLMHRFV